MSGRTGGRHSPIHLESLDAASRGAPAGAKSFLAREELKLMRRELDQVRMERDILKKAVAFFAKESV